ncbi:mechanosensitive ion channel family protein [Marinimicrobium alkaliphilum]|uniref:mechanosensitive ion channel family protein n=1 Tax=Marinimicrobium alkaliphilum TaxID=2202654 RepID=UPI000DBAD09A|nr:mechanosensitive ion channel domain-containing protein [Marinimicrobium alkaliphilum]
MKETLVDWLEGIGLDMTPLLTFGIVMGLILAISLLVHIVLHYGVLATISRLATRQENTWRRAIFDHSLFTRIAFALQGIIIYIQAGVWLDTDSDAQQLIQMLCQLWILMFATLALFSLLDVLLDIFRRHESNRKLPLRGIFQSVKLIAAILAIILMISILIGRSPLILFSGLGAMTAVLMLVFKDPIMGLVAGIQLSVNKMLAVGDWLEMPKYGADGEVTDVALTTVKVRNWDNTITTVPTYALIADSFKNWRGMTDAGGRRISRPVHIDARSVHFLSEEEIERLRKAQLITGYIEEKLAEIETYNTEHKVDKSSLVNGRRLTNLGTFRAYLARYLKENPSIHQNMIQMVRQMEPTAHGIPLQVYAFTNDTAWVKYEAIQSDLFDHIFAVLPEFGLRVHQVPTGHDMQQIGCRDQPDN